jgi:hypothetical protein
MLADAEAYATKTRSMTETMHLRKTGATTGEISILFDRARTLRAKIAAIRAAAP